MRCNLKNGAITVVRRGLLLEELERGELAEVISVEGNTDWIARMAELGISPGQQIRILQPGSPCLVSLGGSRLSLRLGQGGRVWVTRAESLAAAHGSVHSS
jgi:ferrous iron transport protein A